MYNNSIYCTQSWVISTKRNRFSSIECDKNLYRCSACHPMDFLQIHTHNRMLSHCKVNKETLTETDAFVYRVTCRYTLIYPSQGRVSERKYHVAVNQFANHIVLVNVKYMTKFNYRWFFTWWWLKSIHRSWFYNIKRAHCVHHSNSIWLTQFWTCVSGAILGYFDNNIDC